MTLASAVIADLERDLLTLAGAAGADGVQEVSGFYAWWARDGALPAPAGRPHPIDGEWHAFYVGISPARPGTVQRLRGRVVGNHMRGNTGASTFRLALAALLREERGYEPRLKINSKGRHKYVLPREQNQDLAAWQAEQLRVTWAECEEPYRPGLEAAVIAHFQPALNTADNASHPFAAQLAAARGAFRKAAAS